jgi:hypothetical protein
VKLLFLLSQANLTRHFDSVLLTLADRGHHVHVASPRIEHIPLTGALARHPRITDGKCPDGRGDRWRDAVRTLRCMADYARYLDPDFAAAVKLRDRACRTMAKALTADARTHVKVRCPSCGTRIMDDDVAQLVRGLGDAGVAGFRRLLARIEATVPSDTGYDEYLREQRPDAVLVTPLVNLEMSQADWVKAARRARIPVAFPVFSWDNLTTKGLIHEWPDRVFVWNDLQRREAVRYHGVAEDAVVVTGAPRFDAFFAMTPKADRATFCRRLGLDPARPVITYLCSSDFVAVDEGAFVRTWIDDIRREPRLERCGVLIRPHPRLVDQWTAPDAARRFTQVRDVAVAPSRAMNADQLLYDTLFHSAAVVGLNTSAQIEAGILGKPVHTLLVPGFEGGQSGTLHFQYLLRANGGFVDRADDVDRHRASLAESVEGRHDAEGIRRFIERFVRPHGLAQPATPILADAIERLAS